MAPNGRRGQTTEKIWAEGLSASQIASGLSGGVTRNAVIGKVHRLGLWGERRARARRAQDRGGCKRHGSTALHP